MFSGFLRYTKNKITSYLNHARAVFTHTYLADGVGVVFCIQIRLVSQKKQLIYGDLCGWRMRWAVCLSARLAKPFLAQSSVPCSSQKKAKAKAAVTRTPCKLLNVMPNHCYRGARVGSFEP
jgi:hypothetical protein